MKWKAEEGRQEVGRVGRWDGGAVGCDGLERDASRKLVVEWLSFECWFANARLERWLEWLVVGGRAKVGGDELGRPPQAGRSIRLRKLRCRHPNFYHLDFTSRQVGHPRDQGRYLRV